VRTASDELDWTFIQQDWRASLAGLGADDFVYTDPPYAGRHTQYYRGWGETDAAELAGSLRSLPGSWALSDWASDAAGPNPRLALLYPGHTVIEQEHRYVIGANGNSRGRMTEALILCAAK
jgi:DNA adenine methylase